MEEKWQETQIHRIILLAAETITKIVMDRIAQVLTATDRTLQGLIPQVIRLRTSPQTRHLMHQDRIAQVPTITKHSTVTKSETTA